jgi:hypothetical protein
LQGAGKRVKDEPEDFKRDDAQERLIAWLAEYDGSMALPLGKGNVALGYLALISRTISEREGH